MENNVCSIMDQTIPLWGIVINLCSLSAGIRREEKPCLYFCPQRRRAWLLSFRRKKSPSTKSSKWPTLCINDNYINWWTANTVSVVCVVMIWTVDMNVQVFSSFWGSSVPIILAMHNRFGRMHIKKRREMQFK